MNRLARHEAAKRSFLARHVEPRKDALRAVTMATKSPFDILLVAPNGGHLKPTFVEVKTGAGKLSSDQRAFGRYAEYHGSPYVVAHYNVVGQVVKNEELTRPFFPVRTSGADESQSIAELLT